MYSLYHLQTIIKNDKKNKNKNKKYYRFCLMLGHIPAEKVQPCYLRFPELQNKFL